MNKLRKTILNSRLHFLEQNREQNNVVTARQKYVLKVLLISFLVIAIVAQLSIFINLWIAKSQGIDLKLTLSPTIGLIFFLTLLKLTSINKVKAAAFIFLLVLFLLVLKSSIEAGIDNPQTIVMYSLIITMSGVLISPRFSLTSTSVICLSLLVLFLLQRNNIIGLNDSWRKDVFSIMDTLVLLLSYMIIAVVSWLFSREIINALKKTKKSEKEAIKLARELQKEKDGLEIKVEERTKELRESQLRELTRMNNLVEVA